jgi:hypothetical protein
MDSAGLGQGLVVSFCEQCNEPSGSTDEWNFLASFTGSTLVYRVNWLVSYLVAS